MLLQLVPCAEPFIYRSLKVVMVQGYMFCKILLYGVTLNNVKLVNSYFSDAKQQL